MQTKMVEQYKREVSLLFCLLEERECETEGGAERGERALCVFGRGLQSVKSSLNDWEKKLHRSQDI